MQEFKLGRTLLIESKLFKTDTVCDRIIEIGSFDSLLLDSFHQQQVFGQIWKNRLALLSMLSKKDGDLVLPQCQGGG